MKNQGMGKTETGQEENLKTKENMKKNNLNNSKVPTLRNLKGFRDFLPAEKIKRNYVQQKIVETFEQFGFVPLETPTLEYADLLLGKYGDEADKLVYNFLDRGERKVALRYDQTVPSARVLSQYQNELPKYFRRYQIQNVFRADKPQKGRYREFAQCDIDIFGSDSPISDAEILACSYFAFKNVGFKNIKIKINDRQTLIETLSPFVVPNVDVFSIIQSIDKLDKLPTQKVAAELVDKGLDSDRAKQVLDKLEKTTISDKLNEIVQIAIQLGVEKNDLKFTPTLARGLDYYTGMIFEMTLPEYEVGSLGGGGRYDNLINQLSGTDIKAVGVGLGFDRIVDAADQFGLLENLATGTQVMVTIFDQNTIKYSLEVTQLLRKNNISTEIYPQADKLAKQFKLADQKQIPMVIIIGEDEIKQQSVNLKNLKTGKQETIKIDRLVEAINSLL